jgi:hypothetical protein
MSATNPPDEIVKWYTRARRFPQLIGKTPDGASLWGGPYTYTQVIVAAVLLYVGIQTLHLWGRFGLIGNALTLAGVTYGLVLVLGRLPVGARNPLTITAGAVRAISSPTSGHQAGLPSRIRPPHRVRGGVVITPGPTGVMTVPTGPATTPPAPAPQPPRTARPPLTSVQRLLASTGPNQQAR